MTASAVISRDMAGVPSRRWSTAGAGAPMASSARRLRAGIGLPRGQRFRARHRCVPDDPGGRQRRRQYGDPHRQCGIGGGTRHHRAGPVLSRDGPDGVASVLPAHPRRISAGRRVDALVPETLCRPARHSIFHACPLLHAEGRRQPPMFIATVGLDPLCDEGIAYASCAARAGARSSISIYPGIITASSPRPARSRQRDTCWIALHPLSGGLPKPTASRFDASIAARAGAFHRRDRSGSGNS